MQALHVGPLWVATVFLGQGDLRAGRDYLWFRSEYKSLERASQRRGGKGGKKQKTILILSQSKDQAFQIPYNAL